MKNVIVVTTFRDQLNNLEKGNSREKELQEGDCFLRQLKENGARFKRVGKRDIALT